jgi:TolB-like protein
MRKRLHLPLILAAIVMVFSCTQPPSVTEYVKNGKEYGKVKGTFRNRWWNYYERGISFAEGAYYREAVSDFNQAIRQRDEDQRRARTYGMHFVDYFPHRELGITLYLLGDLPAAREELELSLRQFPSAKAHFYLDSVRKKLIEQKNKDVPPPILDLDLKNSHVLTRADPVVISGTASDDNFIKRITINNSPLFIEGSKKNFRFEKQLSLSQGRYYIEIEAENLVEKITKKHVVIVVDREGPVIVIDRIELVENSSGNLVLIGGSMYDESGVAELTINGRRISIAGGIEVRFERKLAIDRDVLEFAAKDTLENETTAQISLSGFKTDTGNHRLLACVNCDERSIRLAGIFGAEDIRPPDIALKGWTETQTVFLEKIYVDGQVQDENKITKLTLNDKPILSRKGNIIFFSQFIELTEGKNTIVLKAEDDSGNSSQKVISIFRRIPKALQLKERLSLTVLPFEEKQNYTEISNSFQDYLINALVNQNRFNIVERTLLEAILQEQKLGRTELFDERTAIKLGKLIAAKAIVAGNIIQSKTGIEIIARMIDTETSAILATADVYDELTHVRTLNMLSQGLAIKFHREFPLLDGMVVQKKGNSIFTNLGKNLIKVQRRLIVFRDIPIKHPLTGKILGSDHEMLGRGRITQVMPEMSKAEVGEGNAAVIKILDKVITE